ncbi:oligosaccharide flippase family protein [Sphingomonas aliaeris]|uniref:Oligosaccharide flippase family protein n=1 Tax=Sphingomonas aliaeris TaxID=2759526 RepID=A0A974S594_9SPHN|nr:oligosaccharide flippase family protein [Sphingomonas aliaeris]QQV78463.1 oligosaccharide flippase family protein [Sphingomonas aliaeris]
MTQRPSKIWRDVLVTYGAQAWIAVMAIAFVPIYIQYLGIEAYGLIGLFATLQGILIVLDLGMTPTVMREIARFTGGERHVTDVRDLLRSIEIASVSIAIFTMLAIWASSDWLAHSWFRSQSIPASEVARVLIIMGFVSALRFVEGIFRGAILGLQQQVLYNVIAATMATLRAIGAIAVLAGLSRTLHAFFIWQGIISLVSLTALGIATYRALPRGERGGRFSIAVLRDIRRFAAGMIGISVLAMLLTQIDKILLSRLLGLTEFAHYMLATVIAIALETIVAPVFQAVSPRLSRLHAAGDEAGFIDLYHGAAQLVSVTAGTAAFVLIGFSEIVLLAWTGDAALSKEVAPLLKLLALGYLCNILMWMPYQAQLAFRWTGLTLRMNMVAVVVIVPSLLWAVPRYGAISAAFAWVTFNFSYVVIGIYLMHRRILKSEKWRWYLGDVAAPLASAALVLLVSGWLFSSLATNRLGQIAFLVVSGILALIGAAVAAPTLRSHGYQMVLQRRTRRAGVEVPRI